MAFSKLTQTSTKGYTLTARNVLQKSDMTNSTKRRLHLAAALSARTCLFWSALAYGRDEPETADAPDDEATVAAAVAKAKVFAPTIESTATAEPTPSPTPTDIPPAPTTPTAAPGVQATSGAEPLAPRVIDDANASLADISGTERSSRPRCSKPSSSASRSWQVHRRDRGSQGRQDAKQGA